MPAAAAAPQAAPLTLSGLRISPGHTPHRSSLPPGAGFLLQAPVKTAGAVATPAAPCAALGLPAALRAVNLPSLLSLQRSSHLLLLHRHSSSLACRACVLQLGYEERGGILAGEKSPSKPGGRDQGVCDSGRETLRTNPRKQSRICSQRLKRGREHRTKAVGP